MDYFLLWLHVATIKLEQPPGEWKHFEIPLFSKDMRQSRWFSQRPVKLSLYNGGTKNAHVDVDNIFLGTLDGRNILSNGDFARQMDHWLFSADTHLPWHIHNLFITILFDQGWFGLFSFSLFALLSIQRAFVNAWHGNPLAAASLAAFCSFLVVGLFDTLIDAPRFLFTLLTLGGLCASSQFSAKQRP